MVHRREEWHVTVDATDPITWWQFCQRQGIKPLYIELSNFYRQVMCACSFDPTELIKSNGIFVMRTKHEVEAKPHEVIPNAVYYECHVKLDGQMAVKAPKASRDLYRADRWYATKRQLTPFDPTAFIERMHKYGRVAGFEYEACVLDTTPALDSGWR